MDLTAKIMDKAESGKTPSFDELLHLASLGENTPEAAELRRRADAMMRRRFSNKVMVLGQIGIENKPCPADCAFCTFAQSSNSANEFMPEDEIVERALEMTSSGKLFALFLMAMHDFDRDRVLAAFRAVRKAVPASVKLVANIGDCGRDYLDALRREGASGAYHVLRLREGTDTALEPASRIATIDAIKSAGLDWYTCCEPIGSEHTSREIVEQISVANEFSCFQNAAMARVNFEGSRLSANPEITPERLAQIVAVVAAASAGNSEMRSVAVHEPEMLSLRSGANSLYAESGKNPRDKAPDTAKSRGRSVEDVIGMFRRAGFDTD